MLHVVLGILSIIHRKTLFNNKNDRETESILQHAVQFSTRSLIHERVAYLSKKSLQLVVTSYIVYKYF